MKGLMPESPDGNTVNLERELMYISQNALEFEANTQFVSGSLARLKWRSLAELHRTAYYGLYTWNWGNGWWT